MRFEIAAGRMQRAGKEVIKSVGGGATEIKDELTGALEGGIALEATGSMAKPGSTLPVPVTVRHFQHRRCR